MALSEELQKLVDALSKKHHRLPPRPVIRRGSYYPGAVAAPVGEDIHDNDEAPGAPEDPEPDGDDGAGAGSAPVGGGGAGPAATS